MMLLLASIEKGKQVMSNPMIYILKKLAIFCQRILSGWPPAVKTVEIRNIHLAQIDRLEHNRYRAKENWELILKSWIFKPAKPPPP
jgi:transcriptional regulator with XRE-family HTH domain